MAAMAVRPRDQKRVRIYVSTAFFQFVDVSPMATLRSSSNGTNPFRKRKALIAVMGATGSGKSSLIGAITGRKDIVGHALESGQSQMICSWYI